MVKSAVLVGMAIGMVLGAVLLEACAYEPSEETLMTYARAKGLYSAGKFSETAVLLAGEKRFAPGLTLRGKAEYFLDKQAQAERTLRLALKRRPSSMEASLYLARILRENGEVYEAKRMIDGLLSDDPSNIRALRFAADMGAGKVDAADFLDRAVEASSETALVFLDRARLRWIAGNGKSALDDLRRARVLVHDDSPLLRSIKNLETAIRGITG
jgi:tetratricopeptide (TPR) repeat protein